MNMGPSSFFVGGEISMTRHRLTCRQSLATGFSLPTGHAYLAHTVEAERLARRVAVHMSMVSTIKETIRPTSRHLRQQMLSATRSPNSAPQVHVDALQRLDM